MAQRGCPTSSSSTTSVSSKTLSVSSTRTASLTSSFPTQSASTASIRTSSTSSLTSSAVPLPSSSSCTLPAANPPATIKRKAISTSFIKNSSTPSTSCIPSTSTATTPSSSQQPAVKAPKIIWYDSPGTSMQRRTKSDLVMSSPQFVRNFDNSLSSNHEELSSGGENSMDGTLAEIYKRHRPRRRLRDSMEENERSKRELKDNETQENRRHSGLMNTDFLEGMRKRAEETNEGKNERNQSQTTPRRRTTSDTVLTPMRRDSHLTPSALRDSVQNGPDSTASLFSTKSLLVGGRVNEQGTPRSRPSCGDGRRPLHQLWEEKEEEEKKEGNEKENVEEDIDSDDSFFNDDYTYVNEEGVATQFTSGSTQRESPSPQPQATPRSRPVLDSRRSGLRQ